MKTSRLRVIGLLLIALLFTTPSAESGVPKAWNDLNWSVAERQPHETLWQATAFRTNPVTAQVTEEQRTYVELATGLNVRQPSGEYLPADPSFALTTNGAAAENTAHHVFIRADIASPGAFEVALNGVTLRMNPLGIGYQDKSGQSVLLAEVTNTVGWLVRSNLIVFSNCFSGIKASLHYENRVGKVSQTIVFHENIAPPSAYGLSDDCLLNLFTEFDPATPLPKQQLRSVGGMTDSTLTFSNALRIGRGTAFALDTANGTRAVSPSRPRVSKPSLSSMAGKL